MNRNKFYFPLNIPQLFQNFQSISVSITAKHSANFPEFLTDLNFTFRKIFRNFFRIFNRFQFQLPQNIQQLFQNFQSIGFLVYAKYFAIISKVLTDLNSICRKICRNFSSFFNRFEFYFLQNIPQLFQNFQSISVSITAKQSANFSEFLTDLNFTFRKIFRNFFRIFN